MLRRNKKVHSLFFILTLLGNSGCTEQEQTKTIQFGLTSEAVTLDPRFTTDAVSDRINRLLYMRLVDFDSSFQPYPALASWKKLSELHYRFVLNHKGRTFHDGSRLTSVDVIASYESVLDEKNASPHKGSLSMIERVEALDSEQIDFFLSKPDPLFPGRLTLGILPAKLIESSHSFNKKPVGSGPLKLFSWEDSGSLILQRLSDLQQVKFITVKDPTVRVLKLVAGELDLFQGDIPFEMLEWVEGQADVIVEKTIGNTFSYLGFNLQDPIVGQQNVREVIALSLDRESLIKYIFKDSARLANAIMTPEHWAGAPALKKITVDQERAKMLLKAMGYDKTKPLKISYKTSNNPFRVRLATAMQHQLKQVGIDLDIQSYDWGTFYGDIKSGNFQMYSLSWVGLKLPDIFRYVFHSNSVPPEGANRGRFSDTEVDQLIELAERETDLAKQRKVYQQLQSVLLERLPYIPLWYENNFLVRKAALKNYQLSSDGNYDGLIKAIKIDEAH